MAIFINKKEIISIYIKGKALAAVYRGIKLVWEAALRIWKGKQIWKGKEVWKY